MIAVFLDWKEHVLLLIKTHRLHQYIDSDDGVSIENSVYFQYEQQDSVLFAWLLSTMSASLHSQLIGSSSSAFEPWEALTRIFGTQSTTQVMRYRYLLHNFKKNDLFMPADLATIKHLCDCLAGCGQRVSIEEQPSTILNGLLPESDRIVSIITTSRVPFDLQGTTIALLDVEARQQARLFQVTILANLVVDGKPLPLPSILHMPNNHHLSLFSLIRRPIFLVVESMPDLAVQRNCNVRFVERYVTLLAVASTDMTQPMMMMLTMMRCLVLDSQSSIHIIFFIYISYWTLRNSSFVMNLHLDEVSSSLGKKKHLLIKIKIF